MTPHQHQHKIYHLHFNIFPLDFAIKKKKKTFSLFEVRNKSISCSFLPSNSSFFSHFQNWLSIKWNKNKNCVPCCNNLWLHLMVIDYCVFEIPANQREATKIVFSDWLCQLFTRKIEVQLIFCGIFTKLTKTNNPLPSCFMIWSSENKYRLRG